MAKRQQKRKLVRRGYLGVWDPTGGEAREGSGLPVEKGEEGILAHRQGEEVEEAQRKDFAGALEDSDTYGMNFQNLPGAEVAGAFWLFIGIQMIFVAIAVWLVRQSGLF